MTTRVEDLIEAIRDIISDDGERWSDARIIRAINIAQKRTVNKYKNLFAKAYLPLTADAIIYQLPEDALLIKRVTYDNVPLRIITHEQLDEPGTVLPVKWEDDTGSKPTAIVVDKYNRNKFRLYPVVESTTTDTFTFSSDFGVVADFPDIIVEGVTFEDTTLGVVTAVNDADNIIVTYVKKPSEVESITSVLEVDPIIDEGLKHYAAGLIFRSDLDAQDRSMANEEFTLYKAEMAQLEDAISLNFTDNLSLESTYRGFS